MTGDWTLISQWTVADLRYKEKEETADVEK